MSYNVAYPELGFINIQHPGNTWGAVAGGSTPRSATVMITREDGDVILAESFV